LNQNKYRHHKPQRYAIKMTTKEAVEQLANAEYADKFQGDEKLATATRMAMDALDSIKPLCNRCLILTKGSICIFCELRDLCDIARKQYMEVK